MLFSLLFKILRPAFFLLPPETAHKLTLKLLKLGIHPRFGPHDSILSQKIAGLNFRNPLGIAAGFDKTAATMPALFSMGLGMVEIGTVTPEPQAGNPKPRIFRDKKNKAVINRMGFPGEGARAFEKNLDAFMHKKKATHIIGVNIGKNKTTEDPYQDYITLIKDFGEKTDYLTVNISSPNTPGLRELQKVEILSQLMDKVFDARKTYCKTKQPPIFFKFAPDLSDEELAGIAKLCMDKKVDGVILANTTLDRPSVLNERFAKEAGGLSGAPLKDKSTEIIRKFYNATDGQIPIIGVGGITSAQDAYEKMRAGASLVQLYTGLVFEGPGLIKEILDGLPVLLEKDGFDHIAQAIGADHPSKLIKKRA